MAEEIRQEIQKSAQEADLVLVGIGTEFSKKNARKEEIMGAYQAAMSVYVFVIICWFK